MRDVMWSLLVVALASVQVGCAAPASTTRGGGGVSELGGWMTGTFDSADQHDADPDNYFNIRLVMLPIWEERDDGVWLYVEQAAAGALDRPYRQRVYHVHMGAADRIVSAVYTIDGDPLRFAGAWARESGFDELTSDLLVLREGCSIALRQEEGRYVGSTLGDGCASSLGDAAYATSEVEITPGLLTSWDRGWTADGERAWGATEGPYEFVKRGDGAPVEE